MAHQTGRILGHNSSHQSGTILAADGRIYGFVDADVSDGGLIPLLQAGQKPLVEFDGDPFLTRAVNVVRSGIARAESLRSDVVLVRATVHSVDSAGVTLRRGSRRITLAPADFPALQGVRKGRSVRMAFSDGVTGVERVTHRRSKLRDSGA